MHSHLASTFSAPCRFRLCIRKHHNLYASNVDICVPSSAKSSSKIVLRQQKNLIPSALGPNTRASPFHSPFRVIFWQRVSACFPVHASLALSFTLWSTFFQHLLTVAYLCDCLLPVYSRSGRYMLGPSATLQCLNGSVLMLSYSRVTCPPRTWFLHSTVPSI